MANFDLNNYVPVHERIVKFYEANPQGRINTAIQEINADGLVIFQAQVFRNPDDASPAATGHAYEEKGNGYINKTSYIENCETSAIGRALANLGIEVQRGIASREEMQKVERMQNAPQTVEQPTDRERQAQVVKGLVKELADKGQKFGKDGLNKMLAKRFGNPNLTTESADVEHLEGLASELATLLRREASAAKGAK